MLVKVISFQLSYFISILLDIVAMTNFLHFPPTFKSVIISDMYLKSLVFSVEEFFLQGGHSWRREKFITVWISHWIVKSEGKYNYQDKAVPFF